MVTFCFSYKWFCAEHPVNNFCSPQCRVHTPSLTGAAGPILLQASTLCAKPESARCALKLPPLSSHYLEPITKDQDESSLLHLLNSQFSQCVSWTVGFCCFHSEDFLTLCQVLLSTEPISSQRCVCGAVYQFPVMFLKIYLFYVCACFACRSRCVCIPRTLRGQKGASDHLEL